MNLFFKPMIFLGTAILLFSAHHPAIAGQTLKNESEPPEMLETITVTAQKAEENIQEVPISMSVFDEFTIEDRNIDNLEDIAKYTPGLEIFGTSSIKSAPSLRGLFADKRLSSSSAGLYIDGAPITGGVGFDETLLDIERVEVLKGPQGTLYGKNAEVGVINVITKKPTNETQGKITGSLGSDDKRDISLNVSGALVEDTFYMGVAAKHYEKDGYVKSIAMDKMVDDREHDYGKINLRWTPTDNLEASLITSKIKYDEGEMSYGLSSANNRETGNDFEGYVKSEVFLTSLNIKYDFDDDFSITSITAYRDYEESTGYDYDYSDNYASRFHRVNDNEFETLSEELRINYENKKIKLVSGIYLEKDESHNNRDDDKGWLTSIQHTNSDIDGDTFGIFSHLTYNVNEKLSLISGLRFDTEQKTYKDSTETIEYDEDELSPKAGLTYDLSKDMMSYLTISKGYRAGGFNVGAEDGYSKTFDKESLYSYEVGLKGTSLNNRLIYDVAVYYMDINDMQVDKYISAYAAIQMNAAKATSKGIEASINFQITDTINLFAGASYTDIKFDEYNDGKADYSGNTTSFSPEYNFNIGATYRSSQGFYARADLTGYGDMYLNSANEYKRDAYELVNAKIGYEQEHYDVYLYAKNLFDKEYDSIGYYNGVYTSYSPPREIGVTLTYRL